MLSFAACSGGGKAQLVGKWEASVTHTRTGTETKMVWEFFPDGTFTAAPLQDPEMFLDRNNYEVLEEDKLIKIRSQLVDNATCTLQGNTITGATPQSVIKFTKL